MHSSEPRCTSNALALSSRVSVSARSSLKKRKPRRQLHQSDLDELRGASCVEGLAWFSAYGTPTRNDSPRYSARGALPRSTALVKTLPFTHSALLSSKSS